MKKCRLRKAPSQGHTGRTAPESTSPASWTAVLSFIACMVWVEVPCEFWGEKIELSWASKLGQDLEKRRGRRECFKQGRNMSKSSKTETARYLRDRAISLASEEGLCCGKRVRKNRVGLLDGTLVTGAEGQATDGCHPRLTRDLFLQVYS